MISHLRSGITLINKKSLTATNYLPNFNQQVHLQIQSNDNLATIKQNQLLVCSLTKCQSMIDQTIASRAAYNGLSFFDELAVKNFRLPS